MSKLREAFFSLMQRFKSLSFKNKIFVSSLAFILLLSLVIALFTRWILISSLTSELKLRGMGIGKSIAERGREFILTENTPELTNLIFDARHGESRHIVLYVFVTDKSGKILAHTFTDDFPAALSRYAVAIPSGGDKVRLISVSGHSVYNVSVSVEEGIYEIGRIHVGINKEHINQLIAKLRITFLGFLSLVTVFFFAISHWLSGYITRPISELIQVAEEISRGNYDIKMSPPTGRDCLANGVCRKSGKPFNDISDNGDCRDCENSGISMEDEVWQLAESFVGMTERIKVSRKKLKESEAKYRSLFQSGPNPIFVCSCEGLLIQAANPTAEEVFGYAAEELKGMSVTELGPLEYNDSDFENRSGDGRVQRVRLKERYYRKDGSSLFVNVHASPARYKNMDALILAITDISEVIEKESQLIQASKMTGLGKMSAGIAHELNQPLNAIKMGSEFLNFMLEDGKEVPEKDLKQVVSEISGQVDRASDIITRLRDFGRKADFSRDRVFVNDPVRSVFRIVERQLSLQNISVTMDLEEDLPPVLAHNNRLEQVFFNLITNARDAITHKWEGECSGSGILIRSFEKEGRACVSVSDNGHGIPEEIRDKVFEAFFTTKEMGEGMGMGLSIISGIIKDYGGTIHVESLVGQGSTFTVSFPLAAGNILRKGVSPGKV